MLAAFRYLKANIKATKPVGKASGSSDGNERLGLLLTQSHCAKPGCAMEECSGFTIKGVSSEWHLLKRNELISK